MAKIKDYSKQVFSEAEKRTQKGLVEATALVERTAKELCAVLTGTLKRSITHEIEPGRAIVGTNIEYAPHVELGTSKWSGKPFLRPALAANLSKIKQLFKGK